MMRTSTQARPWVRWLMVVALIAMGASAASAAGYVNPHLLVEPEWVHARVGDPNVRIVDIRGKAFYDRGHIPGAVPLDPGQLNDPDNDIDGYLIGPEAFQALARSLGINADTTVVVYDQSSSLQAARLFYALELYGHVDKVRILNGGYAAWTQANLPRTTQTTAVRPGQFTARFNDRLVASADHVKASIGKPNVVILDVRSPGEYAGTDVRAKQGGHVPGAVNIEWSTAVLPGTVQRFKSADELVRIYNAAGLSQAAEVIPYCQTNVRGAHTYFVLRLLGFSNIRPYEGSWAEWGNRTDVPIAKGS